MNEQHRQVLLGECTTLSYTFAPTVVRMHRRSLTNEGVVSSARPTPQIEKQDRLIDIRGAKNEKTKGRKRNRRWGKRKEVG